VILKVISPIII